MIYESGSIPAHAGEPVQNLGPHAPSTVYPRACGGTPFMYGDGVKTGGLSPRMRGNHRNISGQFHGLWSIPAHAGEPPSKLPCSFTHKVYPRACGGTRWPMVQTGSGTGLSPRMRGNLVNAITDLSYPGSIPAHAGEPESPSVGTKAVKVYPRACGGTGWQLFQLGLAEGLSPRMRGNPRPPKFLGHF